MTPRTPHIEGRPISASSYRNYGCRCPDCTSLASAKAKAAKNTPKVRAYDAWRQRRDRACSAWLKQNMPQVFNEISAGTR